MLAGGVGRWRTGEGGARGGGGQLLVGQTLVESSEYSRQGLTRLFISNQPGGVPALLLGLWPARVSWSMTFSKSVQQTLNLDTLMIQTIIRGT